MASSKVERPARSRKETLAGIRAVVVGGSREDKEAGVAKEASPMAACGRVAGVEHAGTHGAEDETMPVESVAGVTWWRTRPPPHQ